MHACIASLMFLLAAALAVPAWAWTVPATGVTTCYNNTEAISCPTKGQAFYGQNGTYPGTSHTFATDADTATDQVTGLVWQRVPDGQPRSWSDAGAYCEALELGGQSDWRLPHQRELVTLVDYTASKPAWNAALSGTSGHYWSVTPYQGYAGPYWYVNFAYGVSEFNAGADGRYVRCVRGQALAESAFVDQGTTVDDTTTGLTWEKAGSGAAMTWLDALAYCQSRSTGGHADWRAPNVMELRTLVNYSLVFPAIDGTLFPDSQHTFWTGTNSTALPTVAWTAEFLMGLSANVDKTASAAYVRCVRDTGGQGFSIAPVLGLLLQ
ncbi:MAG: DUF1566 domain-containing protein [Solidesulfovibrio sp. DCME]|uniref:Lcl C-terminal domain-containing protein n=1 Tax=Solidesulfovibrio sp. DCME TaxID=3447380 RepID=UPI003D12BD61